MTDFMDFQEELLTTTREAIELSREYLKARKEYSHYQNQLQVLLYKANLHTSKKSIDNKIVELMAHNIYGEQARELNLKMNEAENTYKGIELVNKSYLAHALALQSVIKTQISSEISENVKAKYNR